MAESQGKSKAKADAHGAAGHTQADGGHKAAFPPFQSETFASQLVSFAIAFVLLYVIVSRLALPRVGGIIESRQSMIDNDLDAAAKLQAESDSALKAYETDLANARASAQAIASDVRDKLNAEQDVARKALEDKLAAQLANAETTIAATRQSAMGNVRAIAADAASAIVERLTGTSPNAGAVVSALDGVLKR